MKDEKYSILIFVGKKTDAYALVERDITQKLEYEDARSNRKYEYEWVNTIHTDDAFSMAFKNENGTKIVYKWRDNGFTVEQIKNADVIVTDNFTTMRDLKQWLTGYGIDRLVLVV